MTDRKEASTLTDAEVEAMARAEYGELDWSIPSNLGATAVQRAWFRMGARALESRLAAGGSPLGRDADWALAMGHALGLNSGFSVPITPSVDAFKELFAAVRLAVGQPVAIIEKDRYGQSHALLLDHSLPLGMKLYVHPNAAAQEHGQMPSALISTGVGQTDDGAGSLADPGMRARNAEGNPPVAAAPDRPQEPQGAPGYWSQGGHQCGQEVWNAARSDEQKSPDRLAQECRDLAREACGNTRPHILTERYALRDRLLSAIDHLAALPQECATVLMELLAAQENYARAHMAEENAINNYSGDQSRYSRDTIDALTRVSKAEAAARALCDRLEKT